MRMNWLMLSVIAMIMWGFWGFFAKLAASSLDWKQAYVMVGLVGALVYVVAFLFLKPQISIGGGFYYAILAGIAGPLGGIAFYQALGNGKASLVIPVAALYPVVTIALAFLVLSEKLTLTHGIGIMLAMASIFFMSL